MYMWLLHSSILAEMRTRSEREFTLSPEQVAGHTALLTAGPSNSRLLSVVGAKAEIMVSGVLTDRPSFMAFLFGGGNTTYGEIRAAIAEAEANPEVDEIILAVDSPGGTVAGLFETLAAVESATKPVTARVANMAASAAFALVSAADKIVATNPAATFGSVGIARTFLVDAEEVTVTSTNAPNKVPDVTTEEGVAVVRGELDDVHELFVGAIAKGRGITAEKVNEDFGRGGVFLAEAALNRGMIDALESSESTKTNTANAIVGGTKIEAKSMNEHELLAQHPELYAAVLNKGVTQERDRVTAHLIMGESHGAMEAATTAIKSGDGMTATIQAQYAAAGLNKNAVASRGADDKDADPGSVDTDKDAEATAKAGFADIMKRAGAQANIAKAVEV